MPSKYSHSVVLAQQSSHGLIHLPNDQYVDYLRSTPLFTTKPPPRPTTAPPRKSSRATSTRTNGSERLAVQHTLRQQHSFDQLATGAYQHQPADVRLYEIPRRLILDSSSSEDDDGEDGESLEFDRQSQFSRPSDGGSSARSPYSNPRQMRPPQRLPTEVQQQVMQKGILSAIPQSPRRCEQKSAARPMPATEPQAKPSVELPFQKAPRRSTSQAQRHFRGTISHNRDVSIPKSLATPQLSPSGTEMTDRGDSPATPFSSLQRGATPTLAEGHRTGLSRANSKSVQSSKITRPAATNMPSQANFDGFVDDTETVGTHFNDLPESQEARNSRLANMRAYDERENAINDLTREEDPDSSKTIRAASSRHPGACSPPQTRFRDRADTLSTLSSFSDFGRPTTSAGAMNRESLITAQQALLEASSSNKHPLAATPNHAFTLSKQKSTSSLSPFAALSKSSAQSQLLTAENLFALPTIPHTPFKQQFDPSHLESTASSSAANLTLAQFLRGLDPRLHHRFADSDDEGNDTAAPPPDIARHPHSTQHLNDPMAHLIIDSRGGVTTVTAQGYHHQQQHQGKGFGKAGISRSNTQGREKKGGRFSSLTRFKGKRR